jgi:fucose permease
MTKTKESSMFFLNISLLVLGAGNGCILTPLNVYIARYFPWRTPSAMTALYACLGLGFAVAPLLVSASFSIGFWWLHPLLTALALGGLAAAIHYVLPPNDPASIVLETDRPGPKKLFNAPFKRFLGIAFLYGVCETVFGNFIVLYLQESKAMSLQMAAVGLSVFWGCLTAGRVIISRLALSYAPVPIMRVLPWVIMAAFLLIPFVKGTFATLAVIAVGGFGCSGCFPLNVSFAERDFAKMASLVSGTLLAAYMIGFGVATYGIGVLNGSYHYSFDSIFSGSAVIALILALVVLKLISSQQQSSTHFH